MSEWFQIKAGIIEQPFGFGVSSQKNLETAIEKKALVLVGADASADGVRGFKNLESYSFFVKGTCTGEAG